ncbi:hypothetical protein PLANTIT3_60582 [Plantibacter sp. T3]|nr:hypothetical protein PLANTIT3_60582 [Plantibacter sp. T3]
MAFGWPGSLVLGTNETSSFENAMARVPASARGAPSGWSLQARRTSAGSHPSGVSPWSPATTASGVPWPMPVAPSDPYNEHVTRSTRSSSPSSASPVAKARAARIGPTVCELDGPIPMEKRSNADTYAVTGRPPSVRLAPLTLSVFGAGCGVSGRQRVSAAGERSVSAPAHTVVQVAHRRPTPDFERHPHEHQLRLGDRSPRPREDLRRQPGGRRRRPLGPHRHRLRRPRPERRRQDHHHQHAGDAPAS